MARFVLIACVSLALASFAKAANCPPKDEDVQKVAKPLKAYANSLCKGGKCDLLPNSFSCVTSVVDSRCQAWKLSLSWWRWTRVDLRRTSDQEVVHETRGRLPQGTSGWT